MAVTLNDLTIPSGEYAICRAVATVSIVSIAQGEEIISVPDDAVHGDFTIIPALIIDQLVRRSVSGQELQLRQLSADSGASHFSAAFQPGGTYAGNARLFIFTENDDGDVASTEFSHVSSGGLFSNWTSSDLSEWTGLANGDSFGFLITASDVQNPVAPSVSIDATAEGDTGTDVALGATVTGGTYDELDYAWTVSAGSLDDATSATPTWTRPASAQTATISLTVTARGTGINADNGESATASADDVSATITEPLPNASAPTLAISAIAEGNTGTSVALSATLTGGTYDGDPVYSWTTTHGTLASADTATPTWTRPASAATATISLTVTVSGDGTTAASGTSDDVSATASATVVAPVTLNDMTAPSGHDILVRCLWDANIDDPDIFDAPADFVSGDAALADNLSIDQVERYSGSVPMRLRRTGSGSFSAYFGSGAQYPSARLWIFVSPTESVEFTHVNSGGGFSNWNYADANDASIFAGIASGDRIGLLITAPSPAPLEDAEAPTVSVDAIATGVGNTSVAISATLTGGRYDSVAYAWTASGGTLTGATTATPTWLRPAAAGDYTISVVVTATGTGTNAASGTSDAAPSASRSATVTAALNNASAPSVSIDAIPAGLGGTSVELSATISGGEYDALAYAWTASAGSLTGASTATPTWTRPGTGSSATISLTITATGDGTTTVSGSSDTATASRTASLTITDAEAPDVSIAAIADGDPGTTVALSATLTGGAYDAINYAWSVSGGELDNDTAQSPVWTRPHTACDVTITLAVAAEGQGTNAEDGTSDSATAARTARVNASVAYSEGLRVIVGGAEAQPVAGTLHVQRSLAGGASARMLLRGERSDVNVPRGALFVAEDAATGLMLMHGHVIATKLDAYAGDSRLVNAEVAAVGIEQHLFQRVLSTAQARSVALADDAQAQVDKLLEAAGDEYAAGEVSDSVQKLVSVIPGTTVGKTLRELGDMQIVQPSGETDVKLVSDLHADCDIEQSHALPTSRYDVDLDTSVRRVIARGVAMHFVAATTLSGTDVASAEVDVSGWVVTGISRVIARSAVGDIEDGDELPGIWDAERSRFEWTGGALTSSQSVPVEVHGTWRAEVIETDSAANALAQDKVVDVPAMLLSDVRALAKRVLSHERQPIETMTLDIKFRAALPMLQPGQAVTVDEDLQRKLDVYQPAGNIVWLIQELVLKQRGPLSADWTLSLSRRLPDFRERDFWGREGAQRVVAGEVGRDLVVGSSAEGAPQVSQLIAPQAVIEGGTNDIDLSDYFADPDGDSLTYEVLSSDTSVVTASVSGSDLTLTAVAAGSTTVTITASDASRSIAQLVQVAVVDNRAPVAAVIPNMTVSPDHSRIIDLSDYFSDPDGDALTYGVQSNSNASVATASVSGSELTVEAEATGQTTLAVYAEDTDSLRATATIIVTVEVLNRAPVQTASFPEFRGIVFGGRNYYLSQYFSDPDGDMLNYSAAPDDSSVCTATISELALGLALVVRGIAVGETMVTVTASDGTLSVSASFSVIVVPAG